MSLAIVQRRIPEKFSGDINADGISVFFKGTYSIMPFFKVLIESTTIGSHA